MRFVIFVPALKIMHLCGFENGIGVGEKKGGSRREEVREGGREGEARGRGRAERKCVQERGKR